VRQPERVAVDFVEHGQSPQQVRDVFQRGVQERLAGDAVAVHASLVGVPCEESPHRRCGQLDVLRVAEQAPRLRQGLDPQRVPPLDHLAVDERERPPAAERVELLGDGADGFGRHAVARHQEEGSLLLVDRLIVPGEGRALHRLEVAVHLGGRFAWRGRRTPGSVRRLGRTRLTGQRPRLGEERRE
jgi:hypothetical protein